MRFSYLRPTLVAIVTLAGLSAGMAQYENVPKWEIDDAGGTASELGSGGKNFVRELKIARPKPATTAKQLASINPSLPKLLPRFDALMASAEVSSRFDEIYDRKLRSLKAGGSLTPHNYFDLETALRLQDPVTKRKVLLVQTDMDVVTDGSDPVRAPSIQDYDLARSSDWYQPTTSFGWGGKGAGNPFLDYYPKAVSELQEMRAELASKAEGDQGVIWREMLRVCDAQIYRMKARGMSDSTRSELRVRRFLLADRDPFVVLPVPWVKGSAAWTPHIGDYVAVIYKDRVYPAVLGDAGPSDKIGEASLRLARALNPKADGRTRAIEELAVTYLYFPRTRTKFGEPNLLEWQAKVKALLGEIGGLADPASLHDWTKDPALTE
ncbi:MAG: glycoside hydrolase family 75 protein [Verrucomicrobiales bacterium]